MCQGLLRVSIIQRLSSMLGVIVFSRKFSRILMSFSGKKTVIR